MVARVPPGVAVRRSGAARSRRVGGCGGFRGGSTVVTRAGESSGEGSAGGATVEEAEAEAEAGAKEQKGYKEKYVPSSMLDLWRNDLQYLDGRAKQDAGKTYDTLCALEESVFQAVRNNATASERAELEEKITMLRGELSNAKEQVHLSEQRAEATRARLSELVQALQKDESAAAAAIAAASAAKSERDFWFPVAFARDLGDKTMIPFDLFNVPWVLFRGKDGRAACIKDECAHRACPISLGTVTDDGKVQCPYHGWEYTPEGQCTHMPSCHFLDGVYVDNAPCIERDGLVYVWAGNSVPSAEVSRPTGGGEG